MNDDDYQRIEEIKESPGIVDTSKPDWGKIIMKNCFFPLLVILLVLLFIFQVTLFFVKGDGVVAQQYYDRAIEEATAASTWLKKIPNSVQTFWKIQLKQIVETVDLPLQLTIGASHRMKSKRDNLTSKINWFPTYLTDQIQ